MIDVQAYRLTIHFFFSCIHSWRSILTARKVELGSVNEYAIIRLRSTYYFLVKAVFTVFRVSHGIRWLRFLHDMSSCTLSALKSRLLLPGTREARLRMMLGRAITKTLTKQYDSVETENWQGPTIWSRTPEQVNFGVSTLYVLCSVLFTVQNSSHHLLMPTH